MTKSLISFYESEGKKLQGKISFTLKHKLALDLADLEASDIILDIGGGTGTLTFAVNQKKIQAINLDLAKTQLRIAKKRGLEAILCNAQKLPFRDSSVTACFAIEILEHVLNPEQVILETCRVLKEDGALIIVVPNDANWFLYRIISGNFFEAFRNRGHIHDFSPNKEISEVLKGYTVVKVMENTRKPVILGYIIAKILDVLNLDQTNKQKFGEHSSTSYGIVGFLDRIYQQLFPLPNLTLHKIIKLKKS